MIRQGFTGPRVAEEKSQSSCRVSPRVAPAGEQRKPAGGDRGLLLSGSLGSFSSHGPDKSGCLRDSTERLAWPARVSKVLCSLYARMASFGNTNRRNLSFTSVIASSTICSSGKANEDGFQVSAKT
jgi:hypothetical protein